MFKSFSDVLLIHGVGVGQRLGFTGNFSPFEDFLKVILELKLVINGCNFLIQNAIIREQTEG